MMKAQKRTEVLIVGSGSAGIFAATWLARYNIPYTILERRPGPLEIGQADGVQCRTVEIYESFNVSEELLRESWHVLEVAFWGPRESGEGIERKSRAADREKGLSHCPHVILNQARMNGIMLDVLGGFRKEAGRQGDGVEYGWAVKGVEIDEGSVEDAESYCCRVMAEKDGVEEVWEAKYVLVSLGLFLSV
jgi:phenol 2-monooxygenase (NADPH)